MSVLNIVSVAPELFNPNGDSENARVLARRCGWSGIDARVVAVEEAGSIPERLDVVVIGSCSDSRLSQARDVLLGLKPLLTAAMASGVPLLAVGNGLELLGGTLELADGGVLDGLGLIEASSALRRSRATGELVVDGDNGLLVGYENHARDLVTDGPSLGRVLAGAGNGAGSEGLVHGSLYGTHLHGPVLAKNPELADRLLRTAAQRAGLEYRPSAMTNAADAHAAAARESILGAIRIAGRD